ncbi:MAG: Rpp14/Pop5 family protein [Methanoregula sp.]|jgi:ribonuclease P/MRP protein subunit POP5|nr:Rpp14/Pop5 family protein [Methanoregula sp.]
MAVRPPTLREKRRYVLARIDPEGVQVDPKDLYYAMYEAVVSLFGDLVAAAMQPSVIGIESGCALFRCRRGTERELMIALSTLGACREVPVALRILAVSGTLESLRERIAAFQEKWHEVPVPAADQLSGSDGVSPLPPGPESPAADGAVSTGTEYQFGGAPVGIVTRRGHKADVIEKGFKNTRRLYLTTEDLEILHATTIPDGI